VIKPGLILRKNPKMMHLAVIWIFQVQSWMMNRKISGMKMRRITITVLEEMITTIWMRIRMNYNGGEITTQCLLCKQFRNDYK